MLDLGREFIRLDGVDLAPDSQDERLFYLLPPSPRLVLREGKPAVELLRMLDGGRCTEAHLTLELELAHPAARVQAAVDALQARLELRDPPVLSPLPVLHAEAQLVFAGRDPKTAEDVAGLISRPMGAVPISPSPPHRAHLSTPLTPEGAELIALAMRERGAPIGVVFRLKTETLWPAQRVLVEVDWRRTYDHLSTHVRQGSLLLTRDIRTLFERLREERLIRVTAIRGLTDSETAESSMEQALAWVEQALVERFFEPVMPLDRAPAETSLGTVGEIFGVGYGFAFKALTQTEVATGQIDLVRTAVMERTLLVQAHLADLLGGVNPTQHISDVETGHPFFQRFVFSLACATPLEALHVSEVIANWSYGPNLEALRLDAEHPEATAETWADRSPDRSWTLTAEIRLRDDAPVGAGTAVQVGPISGRSRRCVLDLRALLGWLELRVEASQDARVIQTRVIVRQLRDGEPIAESEVSLSEGTWTGNAFFIGVRPGDGLVAETIHLLDDGRQVRPVPQEIVASVLRVPAAFPGEMLVTLYAEGDWEGLERLVVFLEKSPDLPGGTVVFESKGTTTTVALPLPDPSDRSWRYRLSRTVDGTEEEEDWRVTDRPALSLGRYGAELLVVSLEPLGQPFPSLGVHSVQVELRYFDPTNGVREETTLVLGSLNDRQTWKVKLVNPTLRTYQTQITTYYTSGVTRVIPWRERDDALLVIPVLPDPGR